MLLMENFENKISKKQKKYIYKNIKEFKKIVKG
jgi:preprotein translocase subunit SecE